MDARVLSNSDGGALQQCAGGLGVPMLSAWR